MDRIYASGAAGSAPSVPASPSSGYPTAGNPGTGTPATKPGAYWYHMIMEELMAIISAAGITPAPGNLTQLLSALRSAGVFSTPAQFDNTTKAATTEFVKRAGLQAADVPQVSTTTTLGVAYCGKIVQLVPIIASQVVTLPLVSASPPGTMIYFWNSGTQAISVTRQAADVINNGAVPVTSIGISPGDSLVVASSGGGVWLAVGGSAQIGNAGVFGCSLAANGYQKLPSGLIVQWGFANNSASADVTVTFPIAFPNLIHSVVITADATGAGIFDAINSRTLTGFKFSSWTATGTRAGVTGNYWIATGY